MYRIRGGRREHLPSTSITDFHCLCWHRAAEYQTNDARKRRSVTWGSRRGDTLDNKRIYSLMMMQRLHFIHSIQQEIVYF